MLCPKNANGREPSAVTAGSAGGDHLVDRRQRFLAEAGLASGELDADDLDVVGERAPPLAICGDAAAGVWEAEQPASGRRAGAESGDGGDGADGHLEGRGAGAVDGRKLHRV